MYAALFNLEGEANRIISATKSRYECAAENAAVLTADVPEGDRPKILWAQYFDGIGWSVAECPTWDAAYYCEYAHHCGASIITRPEGVGFSESYGGPEVYWYLTDDEFLELGRDAETWIYPSPTFADVYDQKSDILDQFESVRNERVYDTMGQGPFGWHEQRLAEYDVVALDMCSIVGTSSPGTVHNRRWFRSYFSEPVGSPGTCDAGGIDLAYVPAEAQCSPMGSAAVAPDQAGPASSPAADPAVAVAVADPVPEVASPAASPFARSVAAVAVAGIVSAFLASSRGL